MAKKTTEIVKNEAPQEIALPSYAGSIAGEKSRAAANNRPRPRVKLLQGSSKPDLKREFGEGAALLAPDNVLLSEPEQPFVAIPVFLYETYELHRDINDKEGGNMVMDSTSNPNSPLGRLCQLQDADARVKEYEGGFSAKAHHVLNAVLLIDEGEAKGSVAVASWKIRGGGSRSGRNFAGLVARREDQKVWCYMNRFAFSTECIEANGYSWWTLRAANPAENPFVTEDRIAELKAQHDILAQLHATDGIAVVAEDAGDSEIPI